MRKKVFALVCAAALTMMSSMSVLADSPTVATVETPVSTQTVATEVTASKTTAELANVTVSEGFTSSAVSSTTLQSALVAVQNEILNDLATNATLLGDTKLAAQATKAGSKVTAEVLAAADINASTATKDANGLYQITMKVDGVSKSDTVAVLHYAGATQGWVMIGAVVGENSVTFGTPSCSPFVIVKLSSSSVAQSPKTGEVAPFAALIALMALACAAVSYRKFSTAR